MTMQNYGTHDERRSKLYRSLVRTYREVEALHDYMYERWRSELDLYNSSNRPLLESKYEIVWKNA